MKITVLILSLLCLVTGCTALAYGDEPPDGKLRITATAFPLYDFARNIAGDKAHVTMLLPPGSDKHSYEPTPRDIITIKESDLFLYVGGISDDWSARVTAETNSLRLKDSVSPMNADLCCHDGYIDGDDLDIFDEHIWTSPQNAILMTAAIRDSLIAIDEENADYYSENAENYISKLEELDKVFAEITTESARNTIVFADRFAFGYFTEAYGLEYFAAFPNCAEQAEPSALTMAFLAEKIKAEKIPAVFYGELSDKRIATAISRETGAKPLLMHSCHTLTQAEIDNGTGYIDLMRLNSAALRMALN